MGVLSVLAAALYAGQLPPAAPSSPETARVVSVAGQVSALRDSQPWALNPGDEVKLGQMILSGPDGYAVFAIADGSTFEVFPNSRVVFRKTPGNLKDLLDLLLGRVRVHIQKWGGQPNYNRVFTPTAVISVRGTIFDVEVEDEDETTLVMVEEGLVEVQHARRPGTPRLLGVGEWLRIYPNQPLASSRVDKMTVMNAAARAVADAFYSLIWRGRRIPSTVAGVPSTGGTGPLPGDTTVPAPPPLPGDTVPEAPPPSPPPAK